MVNVPPTPVPPHTTTTPASSNIVNHVVKQMFSVTPSDIVTFLGFGAIVIIVVILLIYFIQKRRQPVCDLYALNIDDDNGELSWLCLEKVYDRLYVAYGPEPALVIIPPGTKTYRFKGTKAGRKYVIAYVTAGIGMPLDMSNLVAYHLLGSLKNYMNIDSSDIRSCIAELYKLGEKVTGKLALSPDIKLSVTVNVRELTKSILKRYLQGAHSSILHMFNMFKKVDIVTNIINALARYRESRYGWVKALVTIVTIIGFLAIIAFAILLHH